MSLNFARKPGEPTGADNPSIWGRNLLRWVSQFELKGVKGLKKIPDPNGGYHLEVENKLGGGAAAPLAMWFTGLYDPLTVYKGQQVTVYTPDGGQAGAYVCLIDGTVGITPDTGAPNWFAWPAPAQGVWFA